ncbi:hypothetical protein RJ639_004620 [Escallonia herrerae]|uniref:Uncharacterized protein n=1 Tax=Escallonia herrerae TaxID=1293975 RepID=A0AA88W3Z3_9ASTE|nr:hypothetical protein RJ639_004620 [Escallonia herrerae]
MAKHGTLTSPPAPHEDIYGLEPTATSTGWGGLMPNKSLQWASPMPRLRRRRHGGGEKERGGGDKAAAPLKFRNDDG